VSTAGDQPAGAVPDGFVAGADLDPAEAHIGPFLRRDEAADVTIGLRVEAHHCNEHGTMHGGVQMAMADYAIGTTARFGMGDEGTVSVAFDSMFVDAGRLGDWVEGRACVVRRTGSMVFVRGELTAGERTLLTFSSVVKRLRA
jgi:acyl-coenzyme A thioesterase PaaI-like protein